MRNFRFRALAAVVAFATALLAGCGSSSDSNGNASVRLVNATLTHASINLLANSSTIITGTATDTVSAFASVEEGSPSLQINDANTGGVLAVTAPTVSKDQKFALIAYESGGAVRTSVISEDTDAPAAGTAIVRVFDAATDAGSIDVYITDPAVDITTLSSPTFTFTSSNSVQASNFISFGPGTYRVRVTGQGNTSDLRLDIPSVVLASTQVATVILTPTTGGTLANGSVLVQDSTTYVATRTTSARVRLVAAVTNGATVSANVGGVSIGSGLVAPAIGSYTSVPSGSAINISVNGGSVAAPATPLVPGSDATLLVYGSAGSASANLITDDNHLPTALTAYKLRLVNGLTGATAGPLNMDVNFANVANNTLVGTASPYSVLSATVAAAQLSVAPSSTLTPLYGPVSVTLNGNSVFTVFMLGDPAIPVGTPGGPLGVLRKDR
ncbi:MAG: DUF4397 domain-containing protein [Burkholderiales bacterium]|nr:DUF4397 domain-containing protein [Burkholderiales bacterium]